MSKDICEKAIASFTLKSRQRETRQITFFSFWYFCPRGFHTCVLWIWIIVTSLSLSLSAGPRTPPSHKVPFDFHVFLKNDPLSLIRAACMSKSVGLFTGIWATLEITTPLPLQPIAPQLWEGDLMQLSLSTI